MWRWIYTDPGNTQPIFSVLKAGSSRRGEEEQSTKWEQQLKILRALHWRDENFGMWFQVLGCHCSLVLHMWYKQKMALEIQQLLWVSEGMGASSASSIRNNQPGKKRKLFSTSSTSPLGKDSVCKCEGGFKKKHLSCSLTDSPHGFECSGKKLLEQCTGCRWQGVGSGVNWRVASTGSSQDCPTSNTTASSQL